MGLTELKENSNGFRVIVRCEFRDADGFLDSFNNEYTGIIHKKKPDAERELWRANQEGFYGWIQEVEN